MQSISVLLATLLFAAASSFANEPKPVKQKYIDFSDVYVQKDRGIVEAQELLLTGMFPNGCYKFDNVEVKRVDEFTHEVRGVASVTQGVCVMVMVPFTREVDLGTLKEGTHTARVMNGDGTILEKTFTKTR